MKIVKGKVIKLGQHRLMCGDATNEDDVAKLMMDEKADMVFTDPPYNANYISKTKGGILNDAMSAEAFEQFLTKTNYMLYDHCKNGASIYECINRKSYPVMAKILNKIFRHRSLIVRNKSGIGMGWHYRPKHELITYSIK